MPGERCEKPRDREKRRKRVDANLVLFVFRCKAFGSLAKSLGRLMRDLLCRRTKQDLAEAEWDQCSNVLRYLRHRCLY